jgi:hypothetical protein
MLKELLEKKGNPYEGSLKESEIITLEKEIGFKINVPDFKFPSEFQKMLLFSKAVSFNNYNKFNIPNYKDELDLLLTLGTKDLQEFYNFDYFQFELYDKAPMFQDYSMVFSITGCAGRGVILMGHKGEYLNQIFYLVPCDWDSYPEFIKLADSLTEFIESLYE